MQEEISLKELILILVKGWKLIVGTTVLSVIAAILGVTVLNTTSYSGELQGKLIKIDEYNTIYGSYRPTYLSIEDQIKQSFTKDFLDYIQKEADFDESPSLLVSAPDGINFTIQYISNSNDGIDPFLKSVQRHLEDYLNYDVQIQAIDSLQKYYHNESIREQRNININQDYIDRFVEKRDQTEKLLGSNINPAYDMIQREITRYEIKQLESQARIETLESDEKLLESYYYENFDSYKKGNEHFDAVSVNLTLSKDINITPITRFNTPLMIVVGAVMGAMLGIFIVYFIQYWKSN